jgi:hypothetical protein
MIGMPLRPLAPPVNLRFRMDDADDFAETERDDREVVAF